VRVDICAFLKETETYVWRKENRVKKVTPAHNRTVKYLGGIDGHLQSDFMGKNRLFLRIYF
jgi:hypothetical protein